MILLLDLIMNKVMRENAPRLYRKMKRGLTELQTEIDLHIHYPPRSAKCLEWRPSGGDMIF